MKTTAIFIPEAFEDIFSTDQQSQSLSQKQLRNELMTKIFTNVKLVKNLFLKYKNYHETSKKSKLC